MPSNRPFTKAAVYFFFIFGINLPINKGDEINIPWKLSVFVIDSILFVSGNKDTIFDCFRQYVENNPDKPIGA